MAVEQGPARMTGGIAAADKAQQDAERAQRDQERREAFIHRVTTDHKLEIGTALRRAGAMPHDGMPAVITDRQEGVRGHVVMDFQTEDGKAVQVNVLEPKSQSGIFPQDATIFWVKNRGAIVPANGEAITVDPIDKDGKVTQDPKKVAGAQVKGEFAVRTDWTPAIFVAVSHASTEQ